MKVTKRRGRWVVDYYLHGKRKVPSFRTKREAEDHEAEIKAERKQNLEPKGDPFITLANYAPRYLTDCRESGLAETTLRIYRLLFKKHIIPEHGGVRVRELRRPYLRTLLSGVVGGAGTKRLVHSVLSGLLALAVDDQIIESNPAHKLFRRRRTKARAARQVTPRTVKAMTREQRDRFLAAPAADPEAYTGFLFGFLTGLRPGELLGLRLPDVDVQTRKIRVHRQLGIETTKSGVERMVDLANVLASHIEELSARRREAAFRDGQPVSEWVVFPWLPEKPERADIVRAERRFRSAMERTLKAAELPRHFTPHAMRHTFCTLLIASGWSPVYVQQQAGHADVSFTVGVYGSWFPVEQPGAVDELARGAPRAEPVAEPVETGSTAQTPSAHVLPPTGTCGPRTHQSTSTLD